MDIVKISTWFVSVKWSSIHYYERRKISFWLDFSQCFIFFTENFFHYNSSITLDENQYTDIENPSKQNIWPNVVYCLHDFRNIMYAPNTQKLCTNPQHTSYFKNYPEDNTIFYDADIIYFQWYYSVYLIHILHVP